MLGVGVLLARQGRLSVFERDVFRLFNDLPPFILPAVWLVMQLGNIAAVPVVAAAAAAFRRYAMARDLLVSGVLGYEAAVLVKGVVGRERPAGLPVGAVLHEGATAGGAGFVSGHAAVAAALAAAAAPYLSRRGRRVVWTLAATVALARVYVGAHLPLDVLGGLALGWAIGSLVHWLLGVPAWVPTATEVSRLVQRFGLPMRELRPAGVAARSSHPFVGVDEAGRPLFVKVLDPDRFERDWLYRLARLVAVRDVKDADSLAPLGQQVEHEAVAMMVARARGVRVPAVALARGTSSDALLVQDRIDARALDSLPAGEIGPKLITLVWEQVALLHAARIAHRDLVVSNVLVDAAGQPWIVDFGNAETGAGDDALAGDAAELMASLALRADPKLVVASAVDQLGVDAALAVLPRLAPLALSSVTRLQLRARRSLLAELRDELYRRLGVPDPEAPAIGRIGAGARAAIAAAAALLLLSLVRVTGAVSVLEAVELNGWRWLGAALVLAVLGRAAAAAATVVGAGHRVAVGRTSGAQLAASTAELLKGHRGAGAAATRYLQRTGLPPGQARTALRRSSVAGVAAAALVAAVAVVLGVLDGRLDTWRAPESVVPLVAVAAGVFALTTVGHLLAGRGAAALDEMPEDDAGRAERRSSATRWAAQVAWAALAVAVDAAALGAALHGFGGRLPLLATAAVYAVLRLLWSTVPATSLPGLAEVALILALTSLGEPVASACAGVLAFRLLTFWAPAAVGSIIAARLEHRFLL